MNRILFFSLSVILAICFLGCGSPQAASPDPDLAGTYIGDLVVLHDVSAKSVYTTTTFKIASDGTISGTARTKDPSSRVGEIGSVNGSVGGGASIPVTLRLDFPTLGKFEAKGSVIYAANTRQLSFPLITTRDANGDVVGKTSGVVQQQ